MSGPEVFSQVNAFRLSETSGSDKRYGTSGLRSFFYAMNTKVLVKKNCVLERLDYNFL